MWVKFKTRHNLFYIIMLILINLFKKVVLRLIKEFVGYKKTSLHIFLMFLMEFIAGLIFYKIYSGEKKEEEKVNSVMGIKLITTSKSGILKPPDSNFKMLFLIFAVAFFDFYDTSMSNFCFYNPPFYVDFSSSLDDSLEIFLAIFTSLLHSFLLNFPMRKHQKCSLITISICIVIIIISEYAFTLYDDQTKNRTILNLSKDLLIIFLDKFFFSVILVIEIYLLEYDFVNPFQMLAIEGGYGLIMSLILCISCFILQKNDPFGEFIRIYNDDKVKDENKFIYLIILLIFYYFLLALLNGYRVITNKLYSPTSIALVYYILGPINLIDNYCSKKNEFQIKGKKNDFYFIFNLILSFIMVFCGCVYNEIFVLFCCDLEHETHSQISLRAESEQITELEPFSPDLTD